MERPLGVVHLPQQLFGQEMGLTRIDPMAMSTISGTSPPWRSSSGSSSVAITYDPRVSRIDTPNGSVNFLTVWLTTADGRPARRIRRYVARRAAGHR